MIRKIFVIFSLIIGGAFGFRIERGAGDKVSIISREEWGARPPTGVTPLELPVPFVVIHHSSEPEVCFTMAKCEQAMRSMQDYHQFSNKWADIGYNFAVGGDGLVYEGRGWARVGAHSPSYNTQSIGIVLIGHWVSELPPERQLDAAKSLINLGLELGFINGSYSLIGHRQVRATECPGSALYKEISLWDHFDSSVVFKHDD